MSRRLHEGSVQDADGAPSAHVLSEDPPVGDAMVQRGPRSMEEQSVIDHLLGVLASNAPEVRIEAHQMKAVARTSSVDLADEALFFALVIPTDDSCVRAGPTAWYQRSNERAHQNTP